MQDSRLAANKEWVALQKSLQLAKKKCDKAKSDKEKAKTDYKNAAETGGKKDSDSLMLLHTRYHQAKAMHQFHKLDFKLAAYQQKNWLEKYADSIEGQPAMLMIDPKKKPPQKKVEASGVKKVPKSVSKPVKKSE